MIAAEPKERDWYDQPGDVNHGPHILIRRTVPISDPAFEAFIIQSRRHRRVRCSWRVRLLHCMFIPLSAQRMPASKVSGPLRARPANGNHNIQVHRALNTPIKLTTPTTKLLMKNRRLQSNMECPCIAPRSCIAPRNRNTPIGATTKGTAKL